VFTLLILSGAYLLERIIGDDTPRFCCAAGLSALLINLHAAMWPIHSCCAALCHRLISLSLENFEDRLFETIPVFGIVLDGRAEGCKS
jgi:hypothetical protein